MTHRSRLAMCALVVLLLPLGSTALWNPASAVPRSVALVDAAGVQRSYAMSLGRPLRVRWHAEGAGHITFFDSLRRFRISGIHHYHATTSDTAPGSPQIRQNVANTASDPGWVRFTEDTCERTTNAFGADSTCRVLARNHYFQTPTEPGHGLAGVWLRFCQEIPGPDRCGHGSDVGYVDNPFL